MIKVFLNVDEPIKPIVKYSWELFCKHYKFNTEYVNINYDISIGFNASNTIEISKTFYDLISNANYHHSSFFKQEPIIFNQSNKKDYLSTAFYLINSIQEYKSTNLDSIKRFTYKGSFQEKFSCIQKDIVSSYFEKLKENIPVLKKIKTTNKKSRFFISHDNDSFYGSLIQDGFWALKKGRIDIVLKLIILETLKKPTWFNLNQIMDINDEYGVKSTFFWLVNKGPATKKINNSDYNINSKKNQTAIAEINKRGFFNGLHKSISKETFDAELKKTSFNAVSNRNHYLKFSLPEHYLLLQHSKIKIDFSLGFAEQFGFRNSYGLPFKPFNLKSNKPFNFLEVPLHIMDTTFHTYLKTKKKVTKNLIIDFLDKNKSEKILSILWHNKFFTPYKFNGYLNIYQTILKYFKEEKIMPINQKEILNSYR